MKRMFRRCIAGALAAAALTTPALAADFTACADRLYDMQLFAGTGKGYELDRTPSRAEASVMLVRLLGREAEARTGKYASPFTDVPAWAKPYVGWLYQNGLAAGVGGGKFGSDDKCTAQMMAAFLLRTLGYTEARGDFAFANALAFAEEKGVADGANQSASDFTRDEMVAMSYTALSRPTRADASSLLASLVADGAVSAAAASDTLALFGSYRAYEDAALASASEPRETETSTVLRAGNASVNLFTIASTDPANERMASQTWEGDEIVSALYYTDGTLYRMQSGAQTAVRAPFDEAVCSGLLPISAVGAIRADGAGYTLTADPAPATRWLAENADGAGLTAGTVQTLTLSVVLEDGELTEQSLTAALTVSGQTLNASYHTATTATGYDVWVLQPASITLR